MTEQEIKNVVNLYLDSLTDDYFENTPKRDLIANALISGINLQSKNIEDLKMKLKTARSDNSKSYKNGKRDAAREIYKRAQTNAFYTDSTHKHVELDLIERIYEELQGR